MRVPRIAAWAMILGLLLLAPMAAADQATLLTTDELKKLVDAGQYRDALKAMLRITDLQGPAAAPYDRFEILMLRAECQLQIKENRASLDTLELVRKEAVAAANDDHANQALALVMLIQKSPGGNYTPRTGAVHKAIAILDRALRKAAYDALFADEFAPLERKVKAAESASNLPPIADAAKAVSAVRPVEWVSTGSNKQTEDMTQNLTKKALKLLSETLDKLAADTQRISDSANRVVTENVMMTDGAGHQFMQQQSHRKGLTTQDAQTLKGVIADCIKIPPAAADMAQGLGGDASPFKAVATKADFLKDKANAVLSDDYGGIMR